MAAAGKEINWAKMLFGIVIIISITGLNNDFGRAWLAQLVRSLLSDHKVPSSIPCSAEI